MKSSWDTTKLRSKYHFDPSRFDPDQDRVIRLGRIVHDWSKDIEEILSTAQPASWATRGYKQQDRNIPSDDLAAEEYDLERVGADPKMTITHLSWKIPRACQRVSDLFGLEDCMTRIHVQMPGEVWNLHLDKLEKWCPENPDRVVRIMIQLTDWQPGQFWEYGNYHHRGWEAGEVTTFDWQNIPHSTANAGHHPRITLQITGVLTEQTKNFADTLAQGEVFLTNI